MKKILGIAFIVLLVAAFSACSKKANYPIIPALTYDSFTVNNDNSATLKVNFTDGDGDIGYPQGSNNVPVDFYIEIFHDSSNTIIPVQLPGNKDAVMGDTAFIPYNVPYITPTGKDKELSGQIQVQIGTGPGTWYFRPDGSYYQYKIWLIDRAGHVSKRITTPLIQCPTK